MAVELGIDIHLFWIRFLGKTHVDDLTTVNVCKINLPLHLHASTYLIYSYLLRKGILVLALPATSEVQAICAIAPVSLKLAQATTPRQIIGWYDKYNNVCQNITSLTV